MKRVLFFILTLFLFSCESDPSVEAVKKLLKTLEQQNIEEIRTMAPAYSNLQDEEIIQLCQNLEGYYKNPQIQITPVDDRTFSVELKTAKDRGFRLRFSMQKNEEGNYILSEDFSLSQRIDFVPAN